MKDRGYSQCEADFLTLVARHGGLFLREQYDDFSGGASTSSAAALIRKLLHLKDATAHRALNRTHVYRLGEAVSGSPEYRERVAVRLPSVFSVKRRLMGLDYVLSHRDEQFLEPVSERVRYFEALGIDRSCLPCRDVHAGSLDAALRFFPDRQPLSVCGDVVTLVYVDPGAVTIAGFKTFLEEHRWMMELVSKGRVVFVADGPRLFPPALRAFDALRTIHAGARGSTRTDELLAYFRARRMFEDRPRPRAHGVEQVEHGTQDRQDRAVAMTKALLDSLRDARERFRRSDLDHAFERWKAEGDSYIRQRFRPVREGATLAETTIETVRLARSYECLGTVWSG